MQFISHTCGCLEKKNTFVFTTLHQLDFYSHQMWSGKALPKIRFVENRPKKKEKLSVIFGFF